MKWPSKVTIKVLSKSKCCVSNLPLYITVISTRKNNYTFGPLLTDENGEVSIRKEDIEAKIEKMIGNFPMDYSGGLNECLPEFEVKIESSDSMKQRIEGGKSFYPEKATELEKFIEDGVVFIKRQQIFRVNIHGQLPIVIEIS